MIKNNIESIYEKMYSYEEELKRNISVKNQLIFTAIFILISTTAYLARFLDFSVRPGIAYTISFLIVVVIIISAISIYFNSRAFSGSEFRRMPYAVKIKEYYDAQVIYWAEVAVFNSKVSDDEKIPIKDPDQVTEIFISDTYAQLATHNALVNETRSRLVFKATLAFLIACAPLAIASFLFVVFDMDTSSPRKNFATKDVYVGDKISALTNQFSKSFENNIVEDLEKRTIILENTLREMRAVEVSNSSKATTSEQKPQPPKAPVKPSAPPSRMTYDEAPRGEKK